MAHVIQITRYRALARRDLPLDAPKGDSDLFPIAAFLWVCSAARVVSSLVHRQTFDIEATLALLCVLGFPAYVFCTRHARDIARQ